VPIFVHPLKEEVRGEVGAMTMSAGALLVPVNNTGNVHFVVQSVLLRGRNGVGEEIFSRELSGWYLLAGVSRGYATTVPLEACGTMAIIEAEVKTDKLPLRGRLVVDRTMCGPCGDVHRIGPPAAVLRFSSPCSWVSSSFPPRRGAPTRST